MSKQGAYALIGNNELKWLESGDSHVQIWKDFLLSMPYCIKWNNYLFVHAAVKKNVALNLQDPNYLAGMIPVIPKSYNERTTVVFGHIPSVRLGAKEGTVFVSDGMLGIDTGAGKGGFLSLVDITNRIVYAIHTGDQTQIVTYNINEEKCLLV